MLDVKNGYQNKYFSILGDSISTFEGISEPKNAAYYDTARKLASGVITVSDTWWGRVVERLGGKLLVNGSWSGSTVCRQPSYEIPSYGCSDERTSALGKDGVLPDVIAVFMGTNDWGLGFRVNDGRRAEDGTENESFFSVAYGKMLKKLRQNYPQAEIWCMTLPIGCCSAREDFRFSYYQNGRHLFEYCEAIRARAAEYGCRVIDLQRHAPPHDTMDGFHPNASGMKTLADAVLAELERQGL